MSVQIETIVEEAEGTIDKDLLTQTGDGGIFSTGYLHTQPLVEYLETKEKLAYLFDNEKEGVKVDRNDDNHTVAPGSNYRALAAITSKRILFVIGQDSGDGTVEIPFSSVNSATAYSGFRTDRLEIDVHYGTIHFSLRSDPETVEAAEYINQHCTGPANARETARSTETGKEATTDKHTKTESGNTPKTTNAPPADGDESSSDAVESIQVEYIDSAAVSDSSVNLVRETEDIIQDVGTEIRDISEARDDLTRAHNKLCIVWSGEDEGVIREDLDQRVSKIESRLDALQSVSEAIAVAQEIETDSDGNIDAKTQKYTTALNTAEEAGLALPEVEATLSDLQSKSPSGKRTEMIAEIGSVADKLDRVPRYSDMHEHGSFKAQEYSEEFGNWDQALQATEINIEQRLIGALKNVGNELDRAPTKSELDEHGKYNSNWYSKHFEDFDTALAAAGLKKPDEEGLLKELHRLEDYLGCPPTSHHVDQHGQYPSTFYRKAFGSVRKAAEQAEMDYEAAVIDAIRAIAVSLERRPNSKEFDEYAQYSSSYVYNYFDGWREACAVAGVGSDESVEEFIDQRLPSEIMELFNRAPVTDSLPRPDVGAADTTPTGEKEMPVESTAPSGDELLDELETVTDDLGRVPSYTDFYEYEGIDPVEYTEVFGSWKQALEEAAIEIRPRLLAALEELHEELGRPPTRSEIDEHGRYDARWYDDYFSSVDEAFSQAGFESPSRDDLLANLQHLDEELGFVPANHHVEKHGNYSPTLYRKEFGSVKQATEEAGLEYEEDVLETLRDVAVVVEERPTSSDFDEHGRYSSSYVYDQFDTWGEACAAAGVASDAAVEALVEESTKTAESEGQKSSPLETDIDPSPLAEYYEVFGNLNDVQTALLGENMGDQIGETAPMARWHTLVHNRWAGESPSLLTESYGAQQNERTEFAITDYRSAYGNGNLVIEFNAIKTASLPDSVIELLSVLTGMDQSEAAEIRIPRVPDSDVPLPVLVESEAEYERAKTLLDEFPEQPSISVESPESDGEDQTETPNGDSGNGGAEPSGELTDVGGITPSIAVALRNAGYESKEDLRAADTEELMEVDGIESQKAHRIKLLVGG